MLDKIAAKLTDPKTRLWLYTVASALLAVLVGYGVVEADKVPLWLGLFAAVGMVGNGTAAVNTRRQIKDGIL
ncbi:hypothetical protein [Mycobacterium sp. CnD-18-1]|uniref:phage holin n=1 Tax=Mycobacterium sp. CnD-18-1 TaxID=2917744 RepID=UPI001EF2D831|nr:hypothetical protein [Mycobacterium sp. CnD-18-1]MCG7610324.1 hypothetical protein [Mycobacterium sp. CnD-18-1]